MFKDVILVGDTTTHGGKVITGSSTDSVNGRAIARLGDLVDCPATYPGGKAHGVNRIIEGDASTLLEGVPLALEGHRSKCGCQLVGSGNGSVN